MSKELIEKNEILYFLSIYSMTIYFYYMFQ